MYIELMILGRWKYMQLSLSTCPSPFDVKVDIAKSKGRNGQVSIKF
jgi:hypothetical protein